MVEADSAAHAVPEAGGIRMPAAREVDGVENERPVRRSIKARPVETRVGTNEDKLPLRRQDASRFSDQGTRIGDVGVDEGDVDRIDLAIG